MTIFKKFLKFISMLLSVFMLIFLCFYFFGGKNEIRHLFLNLVNGNEIILNDKIFEIDPEYSSLFENKNNSYQLIIKDSELEGELVFVQETKYDTKLLIDKGALEKEPFTIDNKCLAYKFKEPEKVGFSTILIYDEEKIEIVTNQELSISQVQEKYCKLIEKKSD